MKIQPSIITARQAQKEDKPSNLVKAAYWLMAILFFDAFVYAVNVTFK